MYKLAVISLALVGCASKPIIETHVAEKPVPVFCQVETPAECKDAYAVDRVSPKMIQSLSIAPSAKR